MQSRRRLVLGVLCLSIGHGMYAQNTQDTALSLQGFSGVLNTPNAHVQQEGTFSTLYSNQRDVVRGLSPKWEDSYHFSFGLFKFAEIGARLTNGSSFGVFGTPDYISPLRDLSLNAKLSTAPFTSRLRFSPVLAVGFQDPGSGQPFFKSTYVVGSADPFGWLRVSAGYGKGPDRMNGAFSGMELKAFDWVALLGDYDTRNITTGVRVTAPEIPYIRARLTATVSKPVHHVQGAVLQNGQGIGLSGGFMIPLNFKEPSRHGDTGQKSLWDALTGWRVKSPSRASSRPASPEAPSLPSYAPTPTQSPTQPTPPVPVVPARPAYSAISIATGYMPGSLESLQEHLVKAGFVDVRVGLQDKTLVVEYENIRYNHSELDAIGVVCGIASQIGGSSAEELRLVVKRKGLALLQIRTNLSKLGSWLDGDMSVQAPTLTITQELENENQTHFVTGDHNPRRLKPSLVLYPSIATLVGTEYGLFDYVLSIRPELQVPLWRGATAVGRADIPVAWSRNFDDGMVYASARSEAQVDRLMVFQAVRLAPGLVANLGAGRILKTTNGTLNELNWNIKSGMNRLKIIQSWGRDGSTTRNVFLGSYRVQLARQNLAFEAIAGRFYAQDTGFMVSMQRFFGDTSISLYLKDTTTPDDSQKWRQAGLRIDFPLTPRRDMKARPIQVRGIQAYSYSQETGVVSSGTRASNYINPNIGIVPDSAQNVSLFLYDRDRLNEAYILSHTERIRDSWQTFRNKP